MDCAGNTASPWVAVLSDRIASPAAAVLATITMGPTATGVPDTLQMTVAPAGTVSPATHAAPFSKQPVWLRPGGRPESMAQRVPPTASRSPALVQENVPE